MELAADLNRRLDGLENDLPTAASRVLHLQRSVVSSAAGVAGDAASAVAEAASSLFGFARNSVTTVLGQARSGADVTRTVAGDQLRTVTGQAGAQAERVTDAASSTVVDLADRATDRIEGKGAGSGRPYQQWTRAELLARARELGIDGRTRMSKAELIRSLRAT